MTIRHLMRMAVVLAVTLPIPVARGGSLSANNIAMFPKNISEFIYADLKVAHKFPWYAQFKSQALPARVLELERFLETSRMEPNSQIDELAWALYANEERGGKAANDIASAEHLLGIALGHFDIASVKAVFKAHKVAGVEARGYTLYPCVPACEDLFVVFLDSETLAFGQRELVERLIEVRSGAEDSVVQNEKIFSMINQINGRGILWGVLGSGGTRQAIHQMVPEASEFPGAASKLLNKMNGMVISVESSNELEAHFHLVSSSPEAAMTVSQLLRAGLMFRQYQTQESNPEFAKALETVRVAPNGSVVEVSFSVTNDQVIGLIQENILSRKSNP